eukprot:3586846-Rhodomonas_salina.1
MPHLDALHVTTRRCVRSLRRPMGARQGTMGAHQLPSLSVSLSTAHAFLLRFPKPSFCSAAPWQSPPQHHTMLAALHTDSLPESVLLHHGRWLRWCPGQLRGVALCCSSSRISLPRREAPARGMCVEPPPLALISPLLRARTDPILALMSCRELSHALKNVTPTTTQGLCRFDAAPSLMAPRVWLLASDPSMALTLG